MPSAIDQVIFEKTAIPRLEKALDISAARHKLLAQNVANAETPGFRRSDIDFGKALQSAMESAPARGLRTSNPKHIGARDNVSRYRVETDKLPEDGESSVQLDQEMAKVARNRLEYDISARLVRNKFEGLKLAIRGRR